MSRLMDYLNEERRLAKLADKVAKKREARPNSKRLAKKAKKIALLQEKEAARLVIANAKHEERVAKHEERVAKSNQAIAESKERSAKAKAEMKEVWNETVEMMRDINQRHAQQRSDMLNNTRNRNRRNRND